MTASLVGQVLATAALGIDVPGETISKMVLSDILIILGAGFLVLFCFLFWAKYMRKRRRRRKERSHSSKVARESSSSPAPDEEAEPEPEERTEPHHSGRRRYKYRYKRRNHRARNPTLSETGGLPPSRPPSSQETSPLE